MSEVLIVINGCPILRFPSYTEALSQLALYLCDHGPVDSISLTQWQEGDTPTHQQEAPA